MIIKKQYAQTRTKATSAPSLYSQEPYVQTMPELTEPAPLDPYTDGSLGPDDFDSGRLQDRRRTDRRGNFRRIEDQELISRAHEEANAIREVAAVEGFEEGLDQAREVIGELDDAMAAMLNAREDALNSVADDLAAMAVEIAERIMKTEVSCDEALVMSLVRNTIAKVGREQKSILIKVNPVDVRLVKEHMKTDSGLSSSVEIMVVEEDSVDQGSCIVETQAGMIDARFSTQLEVLKRMIATGGEA